MNGPPQIIEQVTRVAPLGLRFWDEVSGRLISDRLTVVAYPSTNPARRVNAVLNRAGVYVFWDLPTMVDFEHGAGDDQFWAHGWPSQLYIVEVGDEDRRFLPFKLPAKLPVQGLFPWECEPEPSSPVSPVTRVPLYSSPSRAVPAGMAVLRAQLWDGAHATPAAWAVLEAQATPGRSVRGLADDQGRVALIFPYPEPSELDILSSPLGSPPEGGRRPWSEQKWSIQLSASYAPVVPTPSIPDLCQVLGQAGATLWSSLSPAIPLTQVELEFGKELVLKSESQSVLYVTPI